MDGALVCETKFSKKRWARLYGNLSKYDGFAPRGKEKFRIFAASNLRAHDPGWNDRDGGTTKDTKATKKKSASRVAADEFREAPFRATEWRARHFAARLRARFFRVFRVFRGPPRFALGISVGIRPALRLSNALESPAFRRRGNSTLTMPTATSSEPIEISQADPLAAFREGQKLAGCYLLQRRVDGFGQRVVWLAHDEVLGKDVSLHFVPAAVLADAEALAVLRHEVKRNRQLIHPSILRVYDFVEEEGWAAVSMDAFTGGTLAARQAAQAQGFFEPAEIKPWLESVCQTLDDAHRIKLAHGDVTPENVIIEDGGRVRVANFGLSICIKHALGELDAAGEFSAHQSPQQLEGAAPTATDDVFGAGVLIHRLVVGAVPSNGTGMAAHRAQLGKGGAAVSAAWEKVVASCLDRSPGARPKSMHEIVQQLALEQPEGGRAVVEEKPVGAKVEEMKPANIVVAAPVVKAEPVVAKVEETKPSNIIEAAPVVKTESVAAPAEPVRKQEAESKPEPAPKRKSEPARPADVERKKPVRKIVADDDDDDYASGGGGGSQWKMIGLGVIGLAAMVWIAMYFAGGDEKRPETKHVPAEPPPSAGKAKVSTPVKPDVPADTANVKSPDAVKTPVVAETPKKEATPAPVVEHKETPAVVKPAVPDPAMAKKAAEMDTARKALEAAEKAQQEAAKRKEKADAEFAEIKTTIEEKSKSLTPLQRAADEVLAGQKKRETEARTAEQAAQQAKLAAADKTRLAEEARKALATADESLASLKKMLEDKATAFAPIKKAADEMAAVRKKRDDDARAAETAAQRAQQQAEEKAALAERAGKAVADGEADGKAKLAAKDQAVDELKELQKTIEEKQRAAGDAAKALADATAQREQQAAVVELNQKTTDEEKTVAERKAQAAANAKKPDEVKTPPEPKGADAKMEDMKKEAEAAIAALKEKLGTTLGAPPSAADKPPKTPATSTDPGPDIKVAKIDPPKTKPEPGADAEVESPKAAVLAGPDYVNSLGMKFAPVGDALFCIWQTRVKDFEAFAKATGLKSTGWRDPGFKQGPEHPVVNVSWQEATLFCKWLTAREHKDGTLGANQEYRLPSDLEWSKAVGLGEESGKTPEARDMGVADVYPWGTQWPPPAGAGNYTGEETGSDVAIHGYTDNFPWTSPVGSFPPNKFGLYDMGGNVWQWVVDNWNNESRAKVLRGASWYNGALRLSLLSSCRVHAAPDGSTDNYGFRIVIVIIAPDSAGKPAHK